MPIHFTPLKTIAALTLAGSLALLGAPAQAWDWTPGTRVTGSGQVTKVQRQVSGFKGIALELPASVEVVQGESEGVLIETDDNIAPLIETVVENEQLKIRMAQRFTAIKPKTLRFTIHARLVESLAVSGSGNIRAAKLKSSSLTTRISGSGDIHIDSLDVDSLSVSITGNGDFFAGGRADSVRSSIAGSGDLKTSTLAAKHVKLSIAGSGNAQVWASQALTVSIAGSGDVGYYGDASVSQSVAGSGRIKKLGNTPKIDG
ncbi:head GIN domain-containing protein [Rhodoferax sp.]|uniref:head GIN domain-containing protein n=1 Tax=Rhodoferax sp. TaxID=50421 RepID=UPI00277B1E50|nr:head GIN domain-containing protein [Rhodoferax sp.]